MAVRPDGRANPNQLILIRDNLKEIADLRQALVNAHEQRFGSSTNLVIGFQLTHSGRFCKPNSKSQMEPRVAYRHPILDRKFNVTRADQVWTDNEIELLIQDYVRAARVAWDAGADFVDIKHCHGYLLHEFLSAFTREGKYGGSFENRTRILREIIAGIRQDGNPIDLAVRLSAFDIVPFKPDPALSTPGKPGPGVPEDYSQCLPYRYAFGVDEANPVTARLAEAVQFIELGAELGVKLVNLTAGSPYYNPHIQRPAAYPPSDGYQPPEDPLMGVARQIQAVRELKQQAPRGLVLIGSAYSYLQEFLPQVAQALVRDGWVDVVGIGRMVLSYPGIVSDALQTGTLATKSICRTFSDCTTAPRNGMISGCYPLDKYYSAKPESQQLKELKKSRG
jgi:2,4-dienoyl-CoA reductase-like NADH-dependent reductase (Old Yellow Enzyme family)